STDAFVESWRLMKNDGVGVLERDGIYCAGTGGAVPYCNQALVFADPADPSGAVAAAITFFDERALRFAVQVPHGSTVMSVVAAHGLVETGIMPFMIRAPIEDTGWRAPPDGLQIARARDARDVDEINVILHET